MGYQVKFYPRDNNIFLMAASDNKIYQVRHAWCSDCVIFMFIVCSVDCQWDARSGSVVQEYNYHLQPVNTITFYDEGRRFVSTSDDKKVLVRVTAMLVSPVCVCFCVYPCCVRVLISMLSTLSAVVTAGVGV